MKTINRFILLFLSLVTFYACEDIIAEDISDDVVQVLFPQNDQIIYSNVVNFQWAELDGADKYRVQIFNSNSGVIRDSLVSQNHVSFPMDAGNYQWRIRGENSAYESNYTFNMNFSVVETTDLADQQIILSSPNDSFYTNNLNLILDWQDLNAADTYNFELVNVTNGESIVNQQSNLTASSVTLNSTILPNDAEYKWKVKGVNGTSETLFSSRKFYLDRVNPNIPQNTLPLNNATSNINQPINFGWSIPGDTGIIQSTISYTIQFSNDISFSSILQTTDVNGTSFQQSFANAGDYYWRVRAKDIAGNIGSYSPVFKFILN